MCALLIDPYNLSFFVGDNKLSSIAIPEICMLPSIVIVTPPSLAVTVSPDIAVCIFFPCSRRSLNCFSFPNIDIYLKLKINNKERKKAIRSALAATLNKELVGLRNHLIPKIFPIIIKEDIESLNKTKEVEKTFEDLGLKDEMERVNNRRTRAGKGKARGRKKIGKKGPLVVVSKNCPLLRSARNLEGVDVVIVDNLNAELLAPGTVAGRLTVYSSKAIERIGKERLFMEKL